jgi:dihydropteroate synthase
MRPTFYWQLRSRSLRLGPRTLIMGVVNVTPDSFSDGGRFAAPDAAVERALRMIEEGADIIDIGGESTRPGVRVSVGSNPEPAGVTAEEELRRVLPVIEAVKRMAPQTVVSVDTYKAVVARMATAAGAEVINDISALRWDPRMAAFAAESGCGLVLMHTRGRPEEWQSLPRLGASVMELVSRELSEWTGAAERAGVSHERIVIDPGFGFGKSFEDNYPLLAGLDELQRLGYPVLAGTSRKSFIGRTVSRTEKAVPPERRLYGTLATVAAAILKGAHIVRVHDVSATREAAAVCDEIIRNSVCASDSA